MNDLISRSALLEKATNATKYDEGGWGMDLKAVSVEDVLKAPAVDAVEVDDNLGEMLNWAVRYSLGRMTYAVNDTVSYVLPLIPKLDRRTLSVMQRDIEIAPEYGHDCDEADWMRLLHAIREELKRRADHDH
jgi:hypothetical protein